MMRPEFGNDQSRLDVSNYDARKHEAFGNHSNSISQNNTDSIVVEMPIQAKNSARKFNKQNVVGAHQNKTMVVVNSNEVSPYKAKKNINSKSLERDEGDYLPQLSNNVSVRKYELNLF